MILKGLNLVFLFTAGIPLLLAFVFIQAIADSTRESEE